VAVLTVAWTIDDAEPDVVTRANPLRRVGDAEPDVLHGPPVAFESGACEVSTVPFVPVNVSHTNVSPTMTVIVTVAARPPASVAVTVAVPTPYLINEMLPPVVVTSFATAEFDVVQVKVADGTALFDESSPCAVSVCLKPSATVGLADVTVTCVIDGSPVTVTGACANVPFVEAVAVSVAVPAN